MAALSYGKRVHVRAPRAGEGAAIASLWRELWDSHERWGGYPGSRDARVYARLARRLDEDARVRAGHPMLGRHIHLVADLGGAPCGQVEGWLESHGSDAGTPLTCEVRSLVVDESARGLGVGRALLDALASVTQHAAPLNVCVLAAEVLDPNPAQGFYNRVGFTTVSWNARTSSAPPTVPALTLSARLAGPQDAAALARLDASLAARRRASGDIRFDGPRAVDATRIASVAAALSTNAVLPSCAETLVATDETGHPRAAATLLVHSLDAPFLPMRRAWMGRLALDPAAPARSYVTLLVALARQRAALQQAPHVELADLPAPGSELHNAVLACGAKGWSRIILRLVPRE